MNARIEAAIAKIDEMSLRERALIFAAVAFALVSLINTILLDPLLAQQKRLSSQVVQQQEKMKEVQAQLASLLQAKQADEHAPQRARMMQLKEQIAASEAYLKETGDRLVPPEKMAVLLEQVLSKNSRLQLVELNTLPVSQLIETSGDANAAGHTVGRQIFKHGVKLTVRGSYLDLLQYLTALEKLPAEMFWGMASMKVVKYPQAELTLTLYTLSLDKTWLQV
ncbi:MAG: type II secretion system protein M [Gammaproteobacteria bacterium]|nr:type II secretion system protein M [Gammaproteobacteria bacterium]MBU1447226.1 type II secretion system protein M [Gammaproteobacteria bacterium]